MDAGRGLDALVAHLVMGQQVTWLRNWMGREPWLLDGNSYDANGDLIQ
jgi:hypothetical protein